MTASINAISETENRSRRQRLPIHSVLRSLSYESLTEHQALHAFPYRRSALNGLSGMIDSGEKPIALRADMTPPEVSKLPTSDGVVRVEYLYPLVVTHRGQPLRGTKEDRRLHPLRFPAMRGLFNYVGAIIRKR